MKEKIKHYLAAISILAVLGMIVSLYLTYIHYSPGSSKICVIDSYINCDIVNQSKYSEIFEIPVAVLGFFGYSVIGLLAFGWLKNWFKEPKHHHGMLLSSAALAFSLYLTYVEFFVLYAICIFCVISQIIILSIFILSLILWLKYSE